MDRAPAPAHPPPGLPHIIRSFLKLGVIGFGGPPAHIALMRDEYVARRAWISPDVFNRDLASANLLPGPTSTELAIYIGYRLRGVSGALAAGACFILPAFVIVLAFSIVYVAYGQLPWMTGILEGAKPVALALIIDGTARLGRGILTDGLAWAVFAATLAALFVAPANALLLMVLAGLITAGLSSRTGLRSTAALAPIPLLAAAAQPTTVPVMEVLLAFLKIGAILYGGGFALAGVLQQELVRGAGWITQQQLLDGITIGQATPGPVFTTATYVGYLVAGLPGAVAATFGIFAPAFAFVLLENRLLARLKHSPAFKSFFKGVNAAVVATIALAAAQLAPSALSPQGELIWPYVALSAVSLIMLRRTRIQPHWLIAIGVAAGIARMLAGA